MSEDRVALRREQPDEQRRKRDDAARAEADRGEERIPHARVKARLRPAVARLGNGGELPDVHKHRGEDGQDGRYLVGNGVDAVGIAPHEPFHQITVRHAHDPPEDSRGDQRHAVGEHLPPGRGTRHRAELPPEPFPAYEKERAQAVGHDRGEQIPHHAPAEHREKEHIERDVERGVEKPLHGVERGMTLGTDELRTESVDAGG